MSQLDSTGLKRLHRSWRQRGHERLALVLDRVQNPFNLGAIVRTAAAERLDHIYLGAATAPDGPKVAKTSLGTERYITWSSFDDPAGAVAAARTDGYRIIGVELAAGPGRSTSWPSAAPWPWCSATRTTACRETPSTNVTRWASSRNWEGSAPSTWLPRPR